MLSRNEILKILSHIKGSLSRYGVSRIGLFGSVARGDTSADSDIDILIDFQNDKETYQNFISACEFLETELKGQKLDIVTLKGLSPHIGKYILNKVVYV